MEVQGRMMRCPVCGVENPEGSRFCGACGRALIEAGRVRRLGWVGVLLAVLVVVGGYVGYTKWYLPRQARQQALRLIVSAMEKDPPVMAVKVTLRGEGTIDSMEAWSRFLQAIRESGFDYLVRDEPEKTPGGFGFIIGATWELEIVLPQEFKALEVGEKKTIGGFLWFGALADKWEILRWATNPQVEVTGIRKTKDTEAEVEFTYKWAPQKDAEAVVERWAKLRSNLASFPQFFRDSSLTLKIPENVEGSGKATLALYDDGWRVVEMEKPWQIVLD